MPINLSDTHCLASVNLLERINGNPTNSTYSGIASAGCIPFIIQNVIFWLLVFAGTAALILLIIGGIKFITSGGDPKQTEGARKTLTYAILGLILILFSFAIVRFIAQTTGLKCITKFGFSQCAYTPKGEYVRPSEISCDPDLYDTACYFEGEKKGLCSCVDKPADEQLSCASEGGTCRSSCAIPGTGLAIPPGGWSDCSLPKRCCSNQDFGGERRSGGNF